MWHQTKKQQLWSIIDWQVWSNASSGNCWIYLFKKQGSACQIIWSVNFNFYPNMINHLLPHRLVFSSVPYYLKIQDTDWNWIVFVIWYLFRWFSNFCCGILKWLWSPICTEVGLKINVMINRSFKSSNNKALRNSQQINNLLSTLQSHI